MSYAAFRRQPVQAQARGRSRLTSIAAPTRGWVTAYNLATPKKQAALVLENFFPTQTGIRPRGGRTKKATIGTDAVERVFHFTGGGADKLFAADGTKIFDITSVADVDVAPAPLVSGQTSGYYSTALFTTSGGTFLIAVNGADLLLNYSAATGWVRITGTNTVLLPYDGQTVNFTPGHTVTGGSSGATGFILKDTDNGASGTLQISAVTGAFTDNETLTTGGFGTAVANVPAAAIAGVAITGLATSALASVWVYKSRLFFTAAGTLNLHYLAVDSIGGALGTKSLGGIFQKGGSLLFGATWSLDAGDGIDEKCVVITDQGEMAIFGGSNPAGSDPGDFDLIGRYDLTIPMGKNGTMRAGGDLLVLTQDGVVPVSEAINKDAAALSLSAVSRPIEPEWQREVRARGTVPWEVAKWPSRNMAVFSLPRSLDTQLPYCFVVNIETGAWCKYTNWDVRSLDVFRDGLYFGDEDGAIWNGEVGGADNGTSYQCLYVGHAEHLGSMGVTKVIHSMRSVFVAAIPFEPRMSVSTDYVISIPAAPNPAEVSGEGWDLSLWDAGVWDAAAPPQLVQTRWVSIGRTGFSINPQLQINCSDVVTPDCQLVTLDLMSEDGGIVV